VKYNYILGNKIALSVKDSADVYCQNNTYAYNSLAFEAYKKNEKYNLGGTIYSVNDALCENQTFDKIDNFSSFSKTSLSDSCKVIKLNDTYIIPQELYYKMVNGAVVLENCSLLEMNLKGAKLIVDDVYEISLNSLSTIVANEQAYIYKKKPKNRKHINYCIDKRFSFNKQSRLSLKINDQIIQLKSSTK